MHPKTEISADRSAIERILAAGWLGQLKIHGHRAQIHIPADSRQEIIAYNRQGKRHAKAIPSTMIAELRRLFGPVEGWNIIDAEWLKQEDRLFVFDLIMEEGELLRRLTFPERWKRLRREYLSPHLITLPLLKTLEECLRALASDKPHVEGLVFKSCKTPGFEDTSIVRCRRR